jgi:hypothetical protein
MQGKPDNEKADPQSGLSVTSLPTTRGDAKQLRTRLTEMSSTNSQEVISHFHAQYQTHNNAVALIGTRRKSQAVLFRSQLRLADHFQFFRYPFWKWRQVVEVYVNGHCYCLRLRRRTGVRFGSKSWCLVRSAYANPCHEVPRMRAA